MTRRYDSWIAVVQTEDGEETEVVTVTSPTGPQRGVPTALFPGTVLELTNGQRITLIEPAGEAA